MRKRVIKILKDICVNQPDFDKVTEICVQILRRILDEEGIKVRKRERELTCSLISFVTLFL